MSEIEDNDGFPGYHAHIPKNKRRKKAILVDESSEDDRPQSKRVRGNRGILKELIKMPLDLLYEIFGRLDPIDLLNLARTTKQLRGLLMSRSSMSIWKQSRSNIEGLPGCPSDLSEPQYANLAFSKNCHFCFRNLASVYISWEARLRTCSKCRDVEFQEIPTFDDRGYPKELARLLPSIFLSTRSDDIVVYYLKLDDHWKKSYGRAMEKVKWLANKLNARKTIDQHARACEIWQENVERMCRTQKALVIEERKKIIEERVRKTLGWDNEYSKMSELDVKPHDLPIVVKACRKKLTGRVLLNLDKYLIAHMEDLQRNRLRTERRLTLGHRLPILKEVYEAYTSSLPVNSVFPTASEVFRDPIVREVIDSASSADIFTKDDFEAIIPQFPHIALRRQRKIEDKLRELITNACGTEYMFDPKTVLHLATTSFSCLSHPNLRYPRVIVHSCATAGRHILNDPLLEVDENFCRRVLRQSYWSTGAQITFKPENWKLLVEIVQMCGFDTKTTTASDMDKANPILECITCNDMHEGRATLSWSAVLDHNQTVHQRFHKSEMELKLLKDEEAELVRARMQESLERRHAGRTYCDMICKHCKRKGNSIGLMRHVMKDHSILKPTREDVVPLLDSNQVPALFRLWPPRIDIPKEQDQMERGIFHDASLDEEDD